MIFKNKKIFFPLFFLFLFFTFGGVFSLSGFFGGGGEIPKDTFTRGLVAYFKFDEGKGNKTYDASGNGNHGTLQNGPKWTKGKDGSALKFDGVDDYVVTANIGYNSNNQISVEAWVKFTQCSGTDGTCYIVAKHQYIASTMYTLYATNTGKLGFGVGGTMISSSAGYNDNKWHHIVGIFDNGNLELYVDGQLIGTGTRTPFTTNELTTIGGDDTSPTYRPFNGIIDEIRIYHRILSPAEIRYHYSRGGPVGYFKFDEGSGTIAYDSSGNGNNGTIYGATFTQGKYGSALSFDGVDDYVEISNVADDIKKEVTIEAWVKAPGIYTLANHRKGMIVGVNTSSGENVVLLSIGDDTSSQNDNEFVVYDGANSNWEGISNTVVADNNWHHVAYTSDGTTGTLYVDGIKKATHTVNYTFSSTNKWFIGQELDGTSYTDFLQGIIDEVKIYSYARTPEEIKLDYNAGLAVHIGPQTSCDEDPGSCMDYGLVGYWKFDEGKGNIAYDTSGNGNHGTLQNGPKWTKGKDGSALKFDGLDDYVDAGSNFSLDNLGPLTFEAWVYPRNIGSIQYIVGKVGGGSSYYKVMYLLPTNRLGFTIAGPTNTFRESVNNVLTPNAWNYIVATWDGTTSYTGIRLFVNGKEVSYHTTQYQSGTGIADDSSSNLWIGNRGDYQRAFLGLIDEVRIYNRALSPAEIRYHYSRGGPVGYWKFDEGSGTTAYDSSGNNNNGIIHGASWTIGKFGTALNFDGVDDYVDLGTGANPADNSFTICFWEKSEKNTGNQTFWTFICNRETATAKGLLITQDWTAANGHLRVQLNDDGGVHEYNVGTIDVSDGKWHHICVVVDRTNQLMHFYVDGRVDVANVDISAVTGSIYSTHSLEIGRDERYLTEGGTDGARFKGLIDEVRIYNYARTLEEIRLDYNAGLSAHFGPQTSCDEDPGSCMDYGLVGYWKFDEGKGNIAYDASGNGNHGTLTNGPKWTKGKDGSALKFDGVDDYVDVGDPIDGSLDFGTGPFSIEFWLYKNYGEDYLKALVTKGDNIIGGGCRFARKGYETGVKYQFNQARLYFAICDAANGKSASIYAVIPQEEWVHVVAVREEGTISLYINGQLKATSSEPGVDVSTDPGGGYNANFYIGRDSVGQFLSGFIDEVRIYNRALSEAEIRYHYNKGKPILHLKFDEGSGTIAYDFSGNGNNGTIYGATFTQGKYGSALSFDGVDDYVDCGRDSTLSGFSAFTIEGWIKQNSLPTSIAEQGSIVGKWDSNPVGEYLLRTDKDGGYHGDILIGDTLYSVEGGKAVAGKWQHVAMTYDGETLRLFVDGILVATNSSPSGAIDSESSVDVEVGRYGSSATPRYVNALLDDIRIYNYARTPDQIIQDYNAGKAIYFR